MTLIEHLKDMVNSPHYAARKDTLCKAAAEIESLQKEVELRRITCPSQTEMEKQITELRCYNTELQKERDELRRQNAELQKELRHWRNEKFEQAVLAANVELKRQNAELELRVLDVVAEYESKMIDIHKQNAAFASALRKVVAWYDSKDSIDVLIDIEKEVKEALAAQPEGESWNTLLHDLKKFGEDVKAKSAQPEGGAK